MEVRLADARTKEALVQDGTLRCVLKIKYKHSDRHSVTVIQWAKRKAYEVSRGLLKAAGLEPEADGLAISAKMVSLQDHRPSYVLYDLYLERCTSEIRERIDGSSRQPIFWVSKRGDVFFAHRAELELDGTIARTYELVQALDKGPRPYFRDEENPPWYIRSTGERIEAPWGEDAVSYFAERRIHFWRLPNIERWRDIFDDPEEIQEDDDDNSTLEYDHQRHVWIRTRIPITPVLGQGGKGHENGGDADEKEAKKGVENEGEASQQGLKPLQASVEYLQGRQRPWERPGTKRGPPGWRWQEAREDVAGLTWLVGDIEPEEFEG